MWRGLPAAELRQAQPPIEVISWAILIGLHEEFTPFEEKVGTSPCTPKGREIHVSKLQRLNARS
jgi:hypothetical protein